MNSINGGIAAPAGNRRRRSSGGTEYTSPRAAAIGQAQQPGFGRQLSSRVASGAITQQQAQRTQRQRQLLENSLGSDWRQQVYGGQGRIKKLRAQAQEGGLESGRAKGILQQLLEARKQALARAMTQAARKRGQQWTGG